MTANLPQDSLDFLRRLHLTRTGQLTNAAAVLFAEDPLNWSPNIAIRIVSFSSDKMSDISNDVLIHGPASKCLRVAVSTIQQRTGYSGRFERTKLQRMDVPAYSLAKQFERLELARLYSIQAGVEINSLRLPLEVIFAADGIGGVKAELLRQEKQWSSSSEKVWKAVMFRALASKKWFCSGGFRNAKTP